MKTLLLFVAAQIDDPHLRRAVLAAGNGITLLIAASLAHLLRRRLKAARPVGGASC